VICDIGDNNNVIIMISDTIIKLLVLVTSISSVLTLGVEVEDVTGKQLEAALQTEELLAVMFYSKNCKTCDRVLSVLERVGEDVAGNGITLVRINDKKASKTHGIRNYPALSMFKMGEAIHYEGDLLDADGILDFLSSPDAKDVPGQIEDVTAAQLEVLVQQQNFLAVFFYDPADKTSLKCLTALESIDDDLDSYGIPAVKMSDVTEARNYGVKSFPSIIVFVKRIPELYQGDVTQEAQVLEWALYQAGIKKAVKEEDSSIESVVEEVIEEIDDMLTFPGASAEEEPVPETMKPKVAPKVNKSQPQVEEEATPEPLSEIVDIIKNDNNVVVFFSSEEQSSERDLFIANEESDNVVSCWPLVCASAKKAVHKGLNIDKLTSKPVIRTGEKKTESVGWISWILGIDLSFLSDDEADEEEEEEVEASEEESESEHEEEEEEEEETDQDVFSNIEFEPIGEVEDLDLQQWYSVNLLGDEEDYFSVDLLGSEYDNADGRDWWEVNLLEGSHPSSWLKVDMFGSSEGRYWYEVNLLGGDESQDTRYVCADVDHDSRSWYEVAWLGFCDDGIQHWYEVDLLGDPTVEQGYTDEDDEDDEDRTDLDTFAVDLLGDYNFGPDSRPWYDMDLYRDPVIPDIDEMEEETTTESGFAPKEEVVEETPIPNVIEDPPKIDEASTKEEPQVKKKEPSVNKETSKKVDEKKLKEEKKEKDLTNKKSGDPEIKKEDVPKKDKLVTKPDAATEKKEKKVEKPLVKEPIKEKKIEDKPKTEKKDPEPKKETIKDDVNIKSEIEKDKTKEKPAWKTETPKDLKKEKPLKEEKKIKITKEESKVAPPTMAPKQQPKVENIKPVEETLSETKTLIKENNNVVGFFYETMDKISKKIVNGLDKVEGSFLGKDIHFLAVDINEVPDLQVASVPSLIYFKNGDPIVYEENLMNEEAIRTWVDSELKSNLDVIEDLNQEQIHDLMDENEYVMVYLYTQECEACDEAIKQLEQIDDDADAVGVKFVKTDEKAFADEYGIENFPTIIYFEGKQPSIYDGDPAEETELLTWMLYQMKEDTVENINRDLLTKMIDDFEFLAVFFYEDNEESVKVLRHLELIDDEASEYGVRMVKINDPLMSKKYGHRSPPGLGFFRKGNYIKFDGDLLDDEEMLDWLTDPNTMEISDQIEKVNKKMFEKLITRNEFLTVFFYSDTDCKQCDGVLQELENIDDDAETAGIPIVKLEDKDLAKTVGVFALPAIVFFRAFGEEAVIYTGDLKREESILEWLMVQKDPSNDAIEELEGDELRKSIESTDAIAVFIYSHEECDNCLETLTELENIDDDVERQKIKMAKTTDASFAEEVGVDTYPALVFFKEGVPNLYEGDLTVEEEVLDWLTEMKVENHIELITRPMLETMAEETQYLAVFFYKQNCRTCDQVIAELENIDDECDMYGIQMVKLKDPPLAKRYGIKTFPALVYFRNGNPLTFDGDLKSEESVLEWLVDDDNRELEDEIEAVNFRMLDKLLSTSSLIAVFFYDDECVECEAILEELETVDDEADAYGIDFVKNNDPHAARQYNIYNTPALVYFRRMSPVVYDGDLMDGEMILSWLTSQDVFETKDEIEEVNRKLLEKLLDENEFVAVYFYEDNCIECDEVVSGLEKIDDETDALDITFVKVNDPRYAKKYGVNKLPALVYFRRKFPSIYRESLFDEDKILEWLTSNRYKQLELGVFMYAIVSLGVTFICYTAFLIFGLKPREPEKKKEE